MTITVTHAKVSNIADDPKAAAAGEVLPSDWNAVHVVTGDSGRTILTQDTNYYVATTGNDSNDGSIGSPWATPQHAADFIASDLDKAGFTITVNIGAGTFGPILCHGGVGGGYVNFAGAGSASTTINTNGFQFDHLGNGANFNVDVDCDYLPSIDKVTIDQTVATFMISIAGAAQSMVLGDPAFVANDLILKTSGASTAGIATNGPALILIGVGTITIVADAINTWDQIIFPTIEGQIQDYSSFVVSGAVLATNPVDSAFVRVQSDGLYINGSATPPDVSGGSWNGAPFFIEEPGSITFFGTSDPAGTFFPGSGTSVIQPGGNYKGITDFVGAVGSLPTANIQGTRGFVTDALAATFGSAPTGGHGTFVPVYNNGTAWIMG